MTRWSGYSFMNVQFVFLNIFHLILFRALAFMRIACNLVRTFFFLRRINDSSFAFKRKCRNWCANPIPGQEKRNMQEWNMISMRFPMISPLIRLNKAPIRINQMEMRMHFVNFVLCVRDNDGWHESVMYIHVYWCNMLNSNWHEREKVFQWCWPLF